MSEVEITGAMLPRFAEILQQPALELLATLHREFEGRRQELLALRAQRVAALAAGATLDFLPDTAAIRADDRWRVPDPAAGLADRRVEITGPTDAKMTINALNSGAKVWLADFEDASSPSWFNVIAGQLNLRDALLGTLSFTSEDGREYQVSGSPQAAPGAPDALPTIVPRPRGWHLPEKHLLIDGTPIAGALVDFGLYLFHCGALQLGNGRGPYFYLPKLESHLEARLWNDVFIRAQQIVGIPRGSIRATVLIETYPAAFEMEEILYELREHAAGLNAGRWDYMFSVIKNFRTRGVDYVLPDRNSVTMTVPFMRAYTELLVRTCHRRGAMAIGGMAAFIPSRRDPEVNARAMAKVREDKSREAADGFDGSWVAHPDLVPICRAVFDDALGVRPNQRERTRDEVAVTAADLLDVRSTPGEVTEAGLRSNIDVAIRYLESWLRGAGAVGIHNLMEDAATAEISRSQVWQWLHNGIVLADGNPVTEALVRRIIDEEVAIIESEIGADVWQAGRWEKATAIFTELSLGEGYVDFLTLPAYELLD